LVWCAANRRDPPTDARRSWRNMLKVVSLLAIAAAFWWSVTSRLYASPSATPPSPSLQHTLQKILATSTFRLGLIDGLARNAVKLAVYLVWTLGLACLPLAALLPGTVTRLWRTDRRTLTVLTLWLAPALAFNLLIHMTEPGHAIWHLAPLYLLLGIGLQQRFARHAPRLAAVVALATALQFIAYPWSESSPGWKRTLDGKAAYLSRIGLQRIDRRALVHTPGDFWRTRAHDIAD
jgi:hypothetical protein